MCHVVKNTAFVTHRKAQNRATIEKVRKIRPLKHFRFAFIG